jgi:hypothetical protein
MMDGASLPDRSEATSLDKVFGTLELFEQILTLADLTCAELARARRVCRQFRTSIDGPSIFQKNLYLEPRVEGSIWANDGYFLATGPTAKLYLAEYAAKNWSFTNFIRSSRCTVRSNLLELVGTSWKSLSVGHRYTSSTINASRKFHTIPCFSTCFLASLRQRKSMSRSKACNVQKHTATTTGSKLQATRVSSSGCCSRLSETASPSITARTARPLSIT